MSAAVAGHMSLNPEFLSLFNCLSPDRQGGDNQNWPIRLPDHVLSPGKLHRSLPCPAVGKYCRATLVDGPVDQMLLKIKEKIRYPDGSKTIATIGVEFAREKVRIIMSALHLSTRPLGHSVISHLSIFQITIDNNAQQFVLLNQSREGLAKWIESTRPA
jgi:hypothetical protein